MTKSGWSNRDLKRIENKLEHVFKKIGTIEYADITMLAWYLNEKDIKKLEVTLEVLERKQKIFILSTSENYKLDYIGF